MAISRAVARPAGLVTESRHRPSILVSQFGQDQWVIDTLHGLRGGFFLDSGAADGLMGSNTLRLERDFGWRGICVEPNLEFFRALERNRTATCVGCCLYSRNGTVDFLEAGPLGGICAHNSEAGSAAIAQMWSHNDRCIRPVVVTRECRTPRSLLDECGAPNTIDYWSLDTEGSELTILQAFPFDRYVVRLISVEHNHQAVRGDINCFLRGTGYVQVDSLGVDDCYALPHTMTSRRSRIRVAAARDRARDALK